MDGRITEFPAGDIRECMDCGAHAVRRLSRTQRFLYGEGDDAVELAAEVAVWVCDECQVAYTEGDAEDKRHEAVCRHRGVMTPQELREPRPGREAVELMETAPPSTMERIQDVFNYAMAMWATSGAPPQNLFRKVAALDAQEKVEDGNYHQCLAIALFFAGDHQEAIERLRRARRSVDAFPMRRFSAWRHREVGSKEFIEDLSAIERLLAGEDVRPAFFAEDPQCPIP